MQEFGSQSIAQRSQERIEMTASGRTIAATTPKTRRKTSRRELKNLEQAYSQVSPFSSQRDVSNCDL